MAESAGGRQRFNKITMKQTLGTPGTSNPVEIYMTASNPNGITANAGDFAVVAAGGGIWQSLGGSVWQPLLDSYQASCYWQPGGSGPIQTWADVMNIVDNSLGPVLIYCDTEFGPLKIHRLPTAGVTS